MPGGGSTLRRRLQRSNRWGTPKSYALIGISFFIPSAPLTAQAGQTRGHERLRKSLAFAKLMRSRRPV